MNTRSVKLWTLLAVLALLLALLPAGVALALTWTAQTSGTTATLSGVAYGGGQFVAVGNGGTILTSPDGVTWTSRTSGDPRNFLSVTHGGGTFVAVGSSFHPSSWPGMVYTSPDGITWTPQTSGAMNNLNDIVYDGSQFVAVGTNGTILTSPDGVTWTPQTSGTTQGLYGITYDGSQFVAVGNGGTILTSPDGVTWTAQTSGTTNLLISVGYGGSQFVAVGNDGTILTSPDGVTWTADTSGTTKGLRGVAYGGSQFVAAGWDGTILTSSEGPSLTLAKSVNPSSAKPGEAITYTISFSNTGAITATNVVITDTLSAHITNPGWSNSGVTLTPIGGQTYAWTAPDLLQGQGGVITITGVLTKPLAAGTIPNTVTLAVSGTVQTANANLTVANVAPVANAGVDQTVSLSETVTLNGSGTDDNGDTLIYGWAQTGGPDVTLSSASAQAPTFTAPSTAGVLTFTLTVTDTGSLTDTDEVVVTAVAGPQITLDKSVTPSSAKPGEAITYTIAFSNTGAITATNVVVTDTLAASITNPSWSSSGVALTPIAGQTYAWTAPDLAQGEGGVIIITGVLTKPLAAGTIPNTVTLAVSGTVQTDNADLTVENVAPVANAGVDQTVSLSETVTLNGSGTDDNGDTLIYGWTQTGGPDVTLSSASAQAPTFTAPSTAGVLTFTLTVTDTGSLTDTDEVVVAVTAGTPGYASLPPTGGTIQFGLDTGGVEVGSTVTSTLTISETGNAMLNITSLVLSGPNAADFSVSPTSFSIVDGGAAQTVNVTCTPAGYGLRTATLTVNHNAAGSPATYTLNCTGLIIYYFPIVFNVP